MSVTTVLAGIGTIEKILPIVEAVGREIGPLVKTEVADGEVVWSDLVKAFNDFKLAVVSVKAAAEGSPAK